MYASKWIEALEYLKNCENYTSTLKDFCEAVPGGSNLINAFESKNLVATWSKGNKYICLLPLGEAVLIRLKAKNIDNPSSDTYADTYPITLTQANLLARLSEFPDELATYQEFFKKIKDNESKTALRKLESLGLIDILYGTGVGEPVIFLKDEGKSALHNFCRDAKKAETELIQEAANRVRAQRWKTFYSLGIAFSLIIAFSVLISKVFSYPFFSFLTLAFVVVSALLTFFVGARIFARIVYAIPARKTGIEDVGEILAPIYVGGSLLLLLIYSGFMLFSLSDISSGSSRPVITTKPVVTAAPTVTSAPTSTPEQIVSSAPTSTPKPVVTAAPTKTRRPLGIQTRRPVNTPQPTYQYPYIGDSYTETFHRPDCTLVSKIFRRINFGNRGGAVLTGYTPCKECNP